MILNSAGVLKELGFSEGDMSHSLRLAVLDECEFKWLLRDVAARQKHYERLAVRRMVRVKSIEALRKSDGPTDKAMIRGFDRLAVIKAARREARRSRKTSPLEYPASNP